MVANFILKITMFVLRMYLDLRIVPNIRKTVGTGAGDRVVMAFDTTGAVLTCVAVPSLFLVSTWRDFPELWSSRNTVLQCQKYSTIPW